MQADAATLSLAEAGRVYRLRPDVVKVDRRNQVVLVRRKDGKSVRVGKAALILLPLLVEGAPFDRLLTRIGTAFPGQPYAAQKLEAFLNQIGTSGLLEGSGEIRAERIQPRLPLWEPDPFMHAAARAVGALPAPIRWVLLGLPLTLAVLGIVLLSSSGRLPHPSTFATRFDGMALALFLMLVVPLHELAHGFACRLAGAPVGPAGLIVHFAFVPGPYIDTSRSYELKERWKRFMIPAAGPIVDLLACGAAAWTLYLVAPESTGIATFAGWLFLICSLFFYFDTNPLTASDGSHMLEAALDDELARSSAVGRARARLSHWRTIATYRVAASMHLQTSLVLLYFWWFHVG